MARERISVDPHQRSRRRQQPGGGKRFMPVIIGLLMLLVFAGAAGGYVYEKKYAPTKELADPADYFGVSGDEVTIYLDEEQQADENGKLELAKCVNGGVFLPYEWVMSTLNRRFFWASDVAEVLYTMPTETLKYGIGDTLNDGSTPFLKLGNGTENLYLNVKLVAEHTNIRFTSYVSAEQKRIFIFDDFSPYTEATVQKKEAVRLLGGVKSPVLTTLEQGANVKVLEAMENWSRVETEDGYIGWLRNRRLSDERSVTPESTYTAPEYTHKLLDQKVVMGFHQVTSQAANASFASATAQAGSTMNVIAPTWFILNSDQGTFTSYWSADYVQAAHAAGYQVWAVVNNFDAGNIDESVFLENTALREQLVASLVSTAVAGGIDGLNIDFELIPTGLGRAYIQFMRELGVACRQAGLVLSADCYVPYNYNSHYDIEELGECIDYVVIMCYDEHYAGSEEGSVASIDYVKRGISEASSAMDSDRVIIALPFYTRVWITGADGKTRSEALSVQTALNWVAQKGVQLEWQEDLGQNYGEITDGTEVKKVWMEDDQSMQRKVDAVKEAGCAGVAGWKLGQEPQSFWSILNLNADSAAQN